MPNLSQAFLDSLTDDGLKELINCLPTDMATPAPVGDDLDQQAVQMSEQPAMKRLSPNFLRTFRATRHKFGEQAARHILYGR
jgi:hypothetical protein